MNAPGQGALDGRILMIGAEDALSGQLRAFGLQVELAADGATALQMLTAADDMLDPFRVLVGADADLARSVTRAPLLTTPHMLALDGARHDGAQLHKLMANALRPRDYSADIQLPGLDIAAGLEHVGGDRPFYFKLVDRFFTSQRSAIDDLQAQAREGRWHELSRRAHTLKGSSANIGALELQQAAAATEQEVHASGSASAPTLQRLFAALQIVFDGIEQHFNPAPADSPPANAAPADGMAAHATLLQLVSDYSGDAPEYFERMRPTLALILPAAPLEQVATALERYEFDTARTVLMSAIPASA